MYNYKHHIILLSLILIKACGGGGGGGDAETITVVAEAVRPVISSASSFTVSENQTSIGSAIASISDYSTLSYSLSGVDSDAISIDSSTGVMTFNSTPDFETKNSYAVKLNVAAGSVTTSQDIMISISNIQEPIVWQLTEPESVGMSSTKLSDAFDKVLADGSYTQGALVIKDSKLVYERYRGIAVNEEKVLKDKNWEGYSTNIQGRLGARDKNSLVTSWSTAKSFTSIVAAIAIEQGYINSLEQSASDFMSEWANDSRKQITIRDLLDMHSGLTMACASNSNGEWILVGNCETSRRDNDILYFDDMLDVCINREMAQTGVDYPWFNDYGSGELWQPGDYVYMNCDTMVMGEVLFRATGKNIETYADLNLFSKIGMDAEWWQDIDGNYLAFCCIDATVRDFAKFGQVILNNGVLDGEQIIPKSYIEKIKNIPSEEKPDNWNIRYPNNSYALNFWTLEPGITDNDTTFPAVDTIFHTLGFDEQMIMIDFTNNMLVLRFSLYELSLNYNVERKYKDNDQYATSNYILSLPGGIGLGGIQNYKPYDFLYDVTQSIDLN